MKTKFAILGLLCAISFVNVNNTMTSSIYASEPSLGKGTTITKTKKSKATAGITAKVGDSLKQAAKAEKTKKVKAVSVKKEKVKSTAEMNEELFKCEAGTGYVNVNCLYIREEPNKNSAKVGTLSFNDKVEYYTTEFEDWVTIADDRYVCAKYLSSEPCKYKTIKAVKSWRKSFESHTVFGSKTRQQRLQDMAHTDDMGFRVVDGRYCIAVGSAIGQKVGTYIDLVLANGTVIPCIMGDQKDNHDTDISNQRTANGCISEFIVSVKALCNNGTKAANRGDVSFAFPEWDSPVVEFHVYEDNILD